MKKINQLIAVLVILCWAGTAQAQNDNGLIGKAKGAAHDCIKNANLSKLYVIEAAVETTGICFVSGETKRVTLSASIPNSEAPTLLIAFIDFDCDGKVSAVTCNY